MERIPFFVVGTAKAGTTSIARSLNFNKQIALASPKETWFFDGPGFEGEDPAERFVRKHIKSANLSNILAFGEVATSYLFVPYVAERIYTCFPNARIVIVLRDPVARAFSDWWMMYSSRIEKLSFKEAIEENLLQIQRGISFEGEKGKILWYDHLRSITEFKTLKYRTYIDYGFYAPQISRYLKYFGKENVKIYFYEEIFKNPEGFFAPLEELLCLPDNFFSRRFEVVNEKYNNRYIKILSGWLSKSYFLRSFASHVKLSSFFKNIGVTQALDEGYAEKLRRLYDSDSVALRDILDQTTPWPAS